MIGSLKGTVSIKNDRFVIIDVGGVGYNVFFSTNALTSIKIEDEIKCFTHLSVRENALDLYGFLDQEELNFFILLNGISGIGPKSALAILSLAPPETLRKAVIASDISYLTKVSGIGRKNAEKIILELRDKLGSLDETSKESLGKEGEIIDALQALGFSLKDSREATNKVSDTTKSTNEQIKEAIKILGKN